MMGLFHRLFRRAPLTMPENTARARLWATVRRLDANNATRRRVQAENRTALHATLRGRFGALAEATCHDR